MHGVEFVFLALAFLFYVARAIFRGIRGLVQWVRRASAPRPVEQGTLPPPSPIGQPTRPRPEARARRPEAGGPAVTGEATGPQFRAQVAEIEETESSLRRPRPSQSGADLAPPQPPGLLRGPDDLLRAVILQEVFARPLSQRRRRPHAGQTPPTPPQ